MEPKPLQCRTQHPANSPPKEQRFRSIDYEAAAAGAITTTIENHPSVLKASKQSTGRTPDEEIYDLQKTLGYIRQEVNYYKEVYDLYEEMMSGCEEFRRFYDVQKKSFEAHARLEQFWAKQKEKSVEAQARLEQFWAEQKERSVEAQARLEHGDEEEVIFK